MERLSVRIRKVLGRWRRNQLNRVRSTFARTAVVDPVSIALIYMNRSGSNTIALARKDNIARERGYSTKIFCLEKHEGFIESFRKAREIAGCAAVVTTHGRRVYKAAQLAVEMWHGFPLKGMSLMDASLDSRSKEQVPEFWRRVDIIGSYGPLYSTVMNACVAADGSKYRTTGMPRNDLLFDSKSRARLLESIDASPSNSRIIFYMPTFREGYKGKIDGAKHRDNIFGFDEFDPDGFVEFLEQEDLVLVLKLHPHEARMNLPLPVSPRIVQLKECRLEELDLDLYDILGGIDLLLTDYSSVFFDLLLVNIPCVFCPVDLEAYRTTRSFLLEPYDQWASGPKAIDQSTLEREIVRSLENKAYYGKERTRVRNLVHVFQDSNSSERTWSVILDSLDSRRVIS